MPDARTLPGPDEYERRYMDGDRALLRARQRQSRWVPLTALAFMGVAVAVSLPSLLWMWAHRDLPGMALVLTVLASWFALNNVALLLSLLTDHITRVVLTATHLNVHRGLWIDEIPRANIVSVTVESSRWWRPQHTLKGALLRRERSYLTPGVTRALRVEWRDDRGRLRKTWVQFDDAPAFAQALGGSATQGHVRVALDALTEGHTAHEDLGAVIDAHEDLDALAPAARSRGR